MGRLLHFTPVIIRKNHLNGFFHARIKIYFLVPGKVATLPVKILMRYSAEKINNLAEIYTS